MIARIVISLALLFALTGATLARWAEYPTGPMDAATVRIQSKAESLYERGDFKRALFIYEKELAKTGDKYAQYMTGYMYLMGQGATADPVRASAWYRLAAERNTAEFVAVRDQLLGTINDEQRARSDQLYVALRRELSDVVIVMNLLLADLRRLNVPATAPLPASTGGPAMLVDPQTGSPISGTKYEARVRDIAQTRLDFLTTRLGMDRLDTDLSDEQIDVLRERVNDYVSVVDPR